MKSFGWRFYSNTFIDYFPTIECGWSCDRDTKNRHCKIWRKTNNTLQIILCCFDFYFEFIALEPFNPLFALTGRVIFPIHLKFNHVVITRSCCIHIHTHMHNTSFRTTQFTIFVCMIQIYLQMMTIWRNHFVRHTNTVCVMHDFHSATICSIPFLYLADERKKIVYINNDMHRSK